MYADPPRRKRLVRRMRVPEGMGYCCQGVCARMWENLRWQRESGYLLEEKVGASTAGRQVGTPSCGNGALSACPVRGAREGEDLVLFGPGLPRDKER